VHLTILRALFLPPPGLSPPVFPVHFACAYLYFITASAHSLRPPSFPRRPQVNHKIPLYYGTGPFFFHLCTPLYPYLTCERFTLHVTVIDFQNNNPRKWLESVGTGKQTLNRGPWRAFRPRGQIDENMRYTYTVHINSDRAHSRHDGIR